VIANPGIILGHECVAEVVEVGSQVNALQPGDHVILDNNLPCGVCSACQEGNGNLCTQISSMGVHIDGVFAQYAVFPDNAAVKLSGHVPAEEAIFAEPLNCVMGAVKKLKIMPGDTILILGGGPIGLYFTALMRTCGAGKILVSEVSPFRSGYAIKNGADRVINPQKEDLAEVISNETKDTGADIVIDAVGVLLPEALKTVKNGGSVLLFGMNAQANQTICQNDITARGITILGNFIGHNTMRNVAKLLESRKIDFKNMITHQIPLKRFAEGLEAMRKGEALEVVLYPFED
jgi:threonine dehydrogenase-like Zn-dependent dehydrogenase